MVVSKKDDVYENTKTILFDIDTNIYDALDVKFKDKTVLLQKFIFLNYFLKHVKGRSHRVVYLSLIFCYYFINLVRKFVRGEMDRFKKTK